MASFNVQAFFERLQKIPGLQNSNWELNQSGIDRGMEAILIQRCTREIATYALARLRLACMPELIRVAQSSGLYTPTELDGLVAWAESQSGGCTTMVNVLKTSTSPDSPHALAAAACLRYYRNRIDTNPVVKEPWTQDGLAVAATLPCEHFLDYPTSGNTWVRKYQTVISLVDHIQRTPITGMTDEDAYSSLRSLSGIGPQSASMISLFWLDRPEPIIDDYLKRVLKAWSMLPAEFAGKSRAEHEALREHMRQGAVAIARSMPGWTPQRVLACIYLWCCEVGRFGLGGVGGE